MWKRDGSKRDVRAELEALLRERVIVGDGAMATWLHATGVPVRTCYEELSLRRPDLVKDAHAAYIRAGADVIQTNTFGAHRLGLDRYGVADDLRAINEAAVRVARAAVDEALVGGAAAASEADTSGADHAPRQVWVFGTIGSTADLGPGSATQSWHHLRGLFEEQLEILLEAGVDGIVLETFADLGEMMTALEVVRAATNLPILATLSPDETHVTRDGVRLSDALATMREAGADVVGLNCRLGLTGIARAYEQMRHVDGWCAAVPNAGLLHMTEGDVSYTGSADYFADMGSRLANEGVRWIGGCCGTTPDHVRALTQRLQQAGAGLGASDPHPAQGAAAGSAVGVAEAEAIVIERPPVRPRASTEVGGGSGSTGSTAGASSLLQKVQRETTVIVELDPPRTTDIARYMRGAEALRDAGADAITLADNSLGTVRVSNMALAALMKPMGIEPLVHVTCRDRNLIGQQSHLMGLDVLGIQHILLVTGDPSRFGDLPGATSVYDVSSIDLTRMVKRLNEGTAFSGRALKHPAKFVVGTSFNPNVRNFDKAMDRLQRKLDAGADYVMTQPVFDVAQMEQIARATEAFGVPVFIGIMPLVSARNAIYLHNEVPGITVADDILQRMTDAPTPEAAVEVGLDVASHLLTEAKQYFNGIYLVTPFLRYELSVRLLELAKAVRV